MSPQKVHLRLRVKLFVLVVHPPCSPHQMWTIIFLKSLNSLKHIWQWECQCFCCAFPRVSTDPLVEIGASTFIAAAADMTEAAAARCTPLHSVSWSFFQACNLCGEIFSPADDKPREEWALYSLEFPWNKVSSEFHNYCGKPSFRTSAGAADRGCAAYFIELQILQETQGTSATCVVKYFLLLLIWQITRRKSIKLI